MQITDSPLAEAGRKFFNPENAQTWINLLRPAFHLRALAEGEPTVAYLGGEPLLPEDAPWPVWEGHGPLSFIAAVDCDNVPADELDIPLPASGTLNFFYFNGIGDDTISYLDPAGVAGGTRVIYVPDGAQTQARPVPDGLEPFPRVLLTGEMIATAPDNENAVLVAAFGGDESDPDAYVEYPYDSGDADDADGDGFYGALTAFRRDHSPHHRIGGYSLPVQGAVEKEAAHVVVPGKGESVKAERRQVASQLVLLAQIDTDSRAAMEWGDTGRLYWLIRREDLAAGRFDEAVFTWQTE